MSKWTHVVGSVRLEHYYNDNNPKEKLEGYGEVLENIFRDTPEGSEGCLDMSISHDKYPCMSTNGEDVSYRWCVSIWGDLRDHSSIKAIVEWINHKTKDLPVRDGVFLIETDYNHTAVVVYTDKGWLEYGSV